VLHQHAALGTAPALKRLHLARHRVEPRLEAGEIFLQRQEDVDLPLQSAEPPFRSSREEIESSEIPIDGIESLIDGIESPIDGIESFIRAHIAIHYKPRRLGPQEPKDPRIYDAGRQKVPSPPAAQAIS
jgi:hypothetical protein